MDTAKSGEMIVFFFCLRILYIILPRQFRIDFFLRTLNTAL
jgi:hypothetical protein